MRNEKIDWFIDRRIFRNNFFRYFLYFAYLFFSTRSVSSWKNKFRKKINEKDKKIPLLYFDLKSCNLKYILNFDLNSISRSPNEKTNANRAVGVRILEKNKSLHVQLT